MNISLPRDLHDFVRAQVATGGYATSNEFICALITQNRDRAQLRERLTDGIESGPGSVMDEAYFSRLRRRVETQSSR